MRRRILLALIIVMVVTGAGVSTRITLPGLLSRELSDPAYAVFEVAQSHPVSFEFMDWGQIADRRPGFTGQQVSRFLGGVFPLSVWAQKLGGPSGSEAALLTELVTRLGVKADHTREVVNGPFRGYEAKAETGDEGQMTVTVKKADPKTGIGGQWVFVTLHRSQPIPSDLVWEKRVRSCLRSLGVKQHFSVTYSGVIDHRLTKAEETRLLQLMLSAADAREPSSISAGNLVSVTAYTPFLGHKLIIGGKPVNLNIALRYSDLEKRTFVTVGSPLITTEY